MVLTKAVLEALKGASSPIAKLYTPEMEVQVNVSQGTGKLVAEGKKSWTDGNEKWHSFRIPFNAKSEATFEDRECTFDIRKRADAIGMTGWNFVKKQSEWVGFDIDSLLNHTNGVSEEEMQTIIEAAYLSKLVNVYSSTSGKGIHLYVFFETPVPTQNHKEHAVLAKALLNPLSIALGINLTQSVDCLGGILWCWAKWQTEKGLQELSPNKQLFPNSLIPQDWQEYSKPKSYISSNIGKVIAGFKISMLDKGHKDILQWFQSKAKHNWRWDTDYSMLVCHTCDLKQCHKDLELKGIFETISQGTDVVFNCFCFPVSDGSFSVRRFGLNTKEHCTWATDKNGWVKTYFNQDPSFETKLKALGGLENSKGEIVFTDIKPIRQYLFELTNLPVFKDDFEPVDIEQYRLKKTEGKITISLQTNTVYTGFIKNGSVIEKVIYESEDKADFRDTIQPDDIVRFVIAGKNATEAGWFINIKNNWVQYNKADVISALNVLMGGAKKNEKDLFIGACLLDPYELVNKPFEDEYVGNRQWNRDAVQLSTTPYKGSFDTWNNMLNHLGKGIDAQVISDDWCQNYGITSGGEYLKYWLAYVFQRPYVQAPYLFFYSGRQNTGKSSFHEATKLLLKGGKGCIQADNALKNSSGWNDELVGAIVCYVEEVDLSTSKEAYNRIKAWVTGLTLPINTKFKSFYEINNTTHWIQCANNARYCPVFTGDTRITVIEVSELVNVIPKEQFLSLLEAEVPYFLYEILNIDLPPNFNRLCLPVIDSDSKEMIIESNANSLELFLTNETVICNGTYITLNSLDSRFRVWLSKYNMSELDSWNKTKIMKSFPLSRNTPKGLYNGELCFGNVCFKGEDVKSKSEFVLRKGQLCLQ